MERVNFKLLNAAINEAVDLNTLLLFLEYMNFYFFDF